MNEPSLPSRKQVFYAGIGSRETPALVIAMMEQLAYRLAVMGYILRSGGADGADLAFEKGCDRAQGRKEIFLPWKGFNSSTSTLCSQPDGAFALAAGHHPFWNNLSPAIRKLMARNSQQVLGPDLQSPSAFVICYTPDGCLDASTRQMNGKQKTGGTGQAIAIASAHNIPVYNLQKPEHVKKMQEFLDKHPPPRAAPPTP